MLLLNNIVTDFTGILQQQQQKLQQKRVIYHERKNDFLFVVNKICFVQIYVHSVHF